MANRCVSPYSEAAPRSPSHSPVPGMVPGPTNQPKRPSSSPGHTAGGAKWKHPAKRGKSPYSMIVGTPRAWRPGHDVTGSRAWDWRPQSPDSKGGKFPQIARADEVQKIRDERMKDDRQWDKTVSNYLDLVPTASVYTIMNEREELTAQVKRLTDLVPRLESEYEQADRAAMDRLASKHAVDLDEKQRMLSQAEGKLYGLEAELGLANVRQKDAEAANVELRGNIQDLRDFKERSMETEKLIQGQVQDMAQRSAQLEQELKEALRLREESDKQLKNAKDDHLSLEKGMLSQRAQHTEAMQQQRDEAAATKQRRDDLENDLRRQFQTEIANLRKEMDQQRLQSQESLQKVTAERNLHQEQTVSAASRYNKELGDLRNEVHEERRLQTQASTKFADAQSEQKKVQETIDALKKELLDEQKKRGAEQNEQTQYLHEMEAQAKSYIVTVEEQCSAAITEAREEALVASEWKEKFISLQVMHQDSVEKASKAEQQARQALDAQKALSRNPSNDNYAAPQPLPKSSMKQPANQALPQQRPGSGQAESAKSGSRPGSAAEDQAQQVPVVSSKRPGSSGSSQPLSPSKPPEPPSAPTPAPPPPRPSAKPVKKIERAGCVFWQVELKKTKQGESYGFTQVSGKEWKLDIEDGPEHWLVKRVMNPGLLHLWNQEHPDAEVIPTDRIVAVNEFTTLHEMQEAQQEQQIKMTICRFPDSFELQLKKNGQKLGFMFEKPASDDQPEIRITKVLQEGALPESNRKEIKNLRWHRVVLPEMCIMAVNDVEGDATRLGEELRICETVRLRIRRPKDAVKELNARRSLASGDTNDNENPTSEPPKPAAPYQDHKNYW